MTYERVFTAIFFVLIYTNVLRAYVLDTVLYVVASTLSIFVVALLCSGEGRLAALFRDKGLLLLFLMFPMALYIFNYKGRDLTTDLFLYYVTPLIYIAFFVVFRKINVRRFIYGTCAVIFAVESAVIIMEVVDSLFGVDIHTTKLFTWYQTSDSGRFEHIYAGNENQGATLEDLLPLALGMRGWPNYSAPLYTVVFAITLVGSLSGEVLKQLNRNYAALLTFFVGLFCIYVLSVKTHFVTAFLSIVIIGAFVDRRIFAFLCMALVGLAMFTAGSDYGALKFELYMEQLFIGGDAWDGGQRVAEGSRLEVIFNFREYLALLELDLLDLLGGASMLSGFLMNTNLFEQKILVYTIILGIPYMAVIVLLIVLGMWECILVRRTAASKELRNFSVAIGCGILVLFLETGHFGFTFNYPLYQILFMLLAASSTARAMSKRESAGRKRRDPLLAAGKAPLA